MPNKDKPKNHPVYGDMTKKRKTKLEQEREKNKADVQRTAKVVTESVSSFVKNQRLPDRPIDRFREAMESKKRIKTDGNYRVEESKEPNEKRFKVKRISKDTRKDK